MAKTEAVWPALRMGLAFIVLKGGEKKMCEDEDRVGMKYIEYFDLYNEIKGVVGDRDVAMAILPEIAKDVRTRQMEKKERIKNSGPATDRQKGWLKKLEIDFGPEMTYGEADKLIEAELDRVG